MDLDKQTVLKTSAFGGFEKKAVLDYIYKLNEDAEYAQAQLQEQLDEAAKLNQERELKVKELAELAERLKKDLDAVKNELEGERARTRKLTTLSENQEEELARYRERLDSKQREAEKYTRENLRLVETNSRLESKSEEVDRASAQIGKLMLDARRDADSLLAKATGEAEIIAARAKQEAGKILESARAEAEAVSRSAREKMDEALRTASVKSEEALSGTRESLDRSAERFEDFRREIADAQLAVTQALEAMFEKSSKAKETLNMALETAGKKLEAAYDPVVGLEISADTAERDGVFEQSSAQSGTEPDFRQPKDEEAAAPHNAPATEKPPEHCFFR